MGLDEIGKFGLQANGGYDDGVYEASFGAGYLARVGARYNSRGLKEVRIHATSTHPHC